MDQPVIDHGAKMRAQDPDFPDYDQRGWPAPLVCAVSELREHAARLREIGAALRTTNALRANSVDVLADSLDYAAAPAERYMDANAGPGLGMQVLGVVEAFDRLLPNDMQAAPETSAWWALVIGAAACIEDAANCLQDPDAKKQAAGAARHYREAAQKLMAAHVVLASDPVQAERERCARIADDEARIREEAGRTHPEDSEARGRCFAAARAAQNVAKGIRSGEVVAEVRGTGEGKANG
jgi:hypothetical protein